MPQTIFACDCGTNTNVEPEAVRLGAVFQCPSCKVVWGHVYPQGGGRAWITISKKDVLFHNLLGRE